MKRSRPINICVICREEQGTLCIECQAFHRPAQTCAIERSAACSHSYHGHCIGRWLKTRAVCPLCNTTWVSTFGLSLGQRAAARKIDSETHILDLVARQLPPSIYQVLDCGVRMNMNATDPLPGDKQRLLAQTFGQYLTVSELEKLLERKRPSQSKTKL